MGMNPAMARAIAQADTMGGGNWPRDGRYLWCVERLWLKMGGYKGDSFIANMFVAEAASTSPEVQPNAVGSTVSYSINMSKNPVAKQLVKTLICGILGAEVSTDPAAKLRQEQEIEALFVGYHDPQTGRQVPAVIDREQPLRGYLVEVEAWTGRTVGKNTPITKYSFKSIKMSDQDRAQWRARLDKEKPLSAGDAQGQGQQYGQPQQGQPQQGMSAQPPAFGQPPAQPQYGQPAFQSQQPAFQSQQPSVPGQTWVGQPPSLAGQTWVGPPQQPPAFAPQQPPAQPQYGQPPAQPPAFGQPPAQPQQYGQPPAQPQQYGQPPAQPFVQQPAQPTVYGQPPVQPPAFGQQPQQSSAFGQPRWPQ